MKVWERTKQLGAEEKLLSNDEKGTIDLVMLLDRTMDLLSAFATQLTYEGLVDEFYGIRQNQLTMPAKLFTACSENDLSPAYLTAEINSGDKLYDEPRNKHFNEVAGCFQGQYVESVIRRTGHQNTYLQFNQVRSRNLSLSWRQIAS